MVAEETGQSQSSAQCEREIERERKNSPNLIQTKVAFDILCELNSISRFSRVCEDVAAWSVERRRREQDDAARRGSLPLSESRDLQAMHKCFPTTFCLSSVDFILTIERAAEVSDANKT